MPEQQREWWFNSVGDNLLKGVVGDDDNPVRLPDEAIVEFLATIPPARESFERVVPQMLPDEQDRLVLLTKGRAFNLNDDPTDVEDNFMASQNKVGIRTTGPRGGGNWYPPPFEEPT